MGYSPPRNHRDLRVENSLTRINDSNPFGIYIHWPFCAAKCPYCDFNSHVRTVIDEAAWTSGSCANCNGRPSCRAMRAQWSKPYSSAAHAVIAGGRAIASVFDEIARSWPTAHVESRWNIRPAPKRSGFGIIAQPVSTVYHSVFRR